MCVMYTIYMFILKWTKQSGCHCSCVMKHFSVHVCVVLLCAVTMIAMSWKGVMYL